MKVTECETPHVNHEDHMRHAFGDVCWGVVRLYIASFRRGLAARIICVEWGYKWTKD